ncbi:MAG TPA: CBS domain-containing protein [Candidatus Binatia bacterium]|jgi:signal-transduction protein with cAMP-binding, CBS, and nucleotidyltransferase domain
MLSNKVSEIMTANLTSAAVTTPVLEVVQLMAGEDVGRVIITDRDVPVGIFTEKDVVRRVVTGGVDPRKMIVKDVMTAPIRAVREETRIVDAFARMYKGKFRHLLVRGRRGRIVGIVSMRRILKIAVELGQGKNETQTLARIATAAATTLESSVTIQETVNLMAKKNLSAVIITEAGNPAGIFTERDVLKRVAAKDIDLAKTVIKQVMTVPPIIMSSTALVGDALAEMYRRDIRNMPVSGSAGEIIGVVSMPDILQYAQAFDIDEQVRRTWKEVAEFLDNEDQYTPG